MGTDLDMKAIEIGAQLGKRDKRRTNQEQLW